MSARPIQRPLRRLSDHALLSIAFGALVVGVLLGAAPALGPAEEGIAPASAPAHRDSDVRLPQRPLRTDRANRW